MTPHGPTRLLAVLSLVALGQFPGASARAASQNPPPPSGLQIRVIDGENAVNIIQRRTAVAPVVEVRDQDNLPVGGASVTFTLDGGNAAAFARGARTITVTTNAAGRATTVLTPLMSGRFQIQIQAAFRGQNAAAAISQTNFATAAAAQAAGAAVGTSAVGGGAATGVAAGAAVAGGAAGDAAAGGLSGVAIGAIAGGAAAGTLVAVKAAGGSSNGNSSGGTGGQGTRFSGPFSGQLVVTTTTGVPPNATTCGSTRTVSGTLTVTLKQAADASVSGTGSTAGTITEIAFTQSPFCSPQPNPSVQSNFTGPLSGTTSSMTFSGQSSGSSTTPATVTSTESMTFVGALSGGTISGTLTLTHTATGTGSGGSPITSSGSVPMPVVLAP